MGSWFTKPMTQQHTEATARLIDSTIKLAEAFEDESRQNYALAVEAENRGSHHHAATLRANARRQKMEAARLRLKVA